jgi:hypothetical protein
MSQWSSHGILQSSNEILTSKRKFSWRKDLLISKTDFVTFMLALFKDESDERKTEIKSHKCWHIFMNCEHRSVQNSHKKLTLRSIKEGSLSCWGKSLSDRGHRDSTKPYHDDVENFSNRPRDRHFLMENRYSIVPLLSFTIMILFPPTRLFTPGFSQMLSSSVTSSC